MVVMKSKQFNIIAVFFLVVSLFFLAITLYTDGAVINWFFVTFALSILSFTLGYVNPRIGNDERSKVIRNKSIYSTFFFVIGYLIIAFGLKTWLAKQVDTQLIFAIVTSLTVITLSISLIIFEKKN
ncbi:hypothetical protein [Pontibacillus litoralis]|uniref:Permease n=1 Tax=Pontibacillus litoralis JSM 072002 TaxID=1385512 RepID=A0A0A5FTH6_9BACI|nr:hypothetical protein [Pontibacillus litoralis]KGX84051.1 hypothetical protein N784_15275 [Pontibacillus litoralis JSM 072002]